ncbi:T9SS type A sorting domain-containing protein [candidate division WOR-3 bacterium]|nr:T9SS type A sorting domain-containing protein [candidate division WOR-3 bacterium]
MSKKLSAVLIILLIAGIGFAQNTVTFNINMSVQAVMGTFIPGTDSVVVRGGTAPLDWGGYDNLLVDPEGDSIYTLTLDFGVATGTVEYKYVMKPAGGSDVWESVTNRTFDLTGNPIVLDTVYFDNVSGVPVEGTVIFQVDLRVQEAVGNFFPGVDHATVRGAPAPLAWEESSAPEMQPWDTIYTASVDFNMPIGSEIQYKYHICPDSLWDNAEEYDGTWESGDNRILLYEPDETGFQIVPLRYFDDVGPEDILLQDVTTIYRVDLDPVFDAIADQGYWFADGALDTVYSVDSMYVAGGTPPLQWVWDLPIYPEELRMYDDGVDPDATADDTVYTAGILFPTGTQKRIEYKYGVNGLDTEAGFAMNHFCFLEDTGDTYLLPPMLFGSLTRDVTLIDDVAEDDVNGEPVLIGELVTVEGVVTVADEFSAPGYIQPVVNGKQTVGVAVFDYDTYKAYAKVGDHVLIVGTVAFYNGLTEIADIISYEIRDRDVAYDTIIITCADLGDTLGEDYEGRLVKILGVTTSDEFPDEGSNANITITDATGSCTMRIDKDTDIDGTTAPTGFFDVVGAVCQYDSDAPYWSGYQIMPRLLGDILVGIEEDEDYPSVYALSQNRPNPFNKTTTISYQLPKSGNVTIGIYNILGEKIATLLDGPAKAGSHNVYWNRKDNRGNMVASGIYFCKMQARTESDRLFKTTRKLVVLD